MTFTWLLNLSRSIRPRFIRVIILTLSTLLLASCSSTGAPINTIQVEGNRVADLQVVDCLLPGMIRRIGNTEFLTPRKPTETTAADCRIRGGEYTAFDRANYKTALAIWMPEAEAGNAKAQTNVGVIFEKGLGGEPNYEAAVVWYERAAKQGNTEAQFNLGTLYEQGLGVEKDKLKALNWYRSAWGIPTDSLIYQSAASKQNEDLRKSLNKAIKQRDSRIKRLERELNKLQSNTGTSAVIDQEQQNEIDELKQWIKSLESEQIESMANLDSVPKLREPNVAAANNTGTFSHKPIKLNGLDFGKYYALIIGNQSYVNIENLDTPKNDAIEMARLLKKKYGFHVDILLDADNISIMDKINDLNDRLGENDNLLIYYAGHGARIKTGKYESGYWLPINADAPPRDTLWVSNESITKHLRRLQANRIIVVADSCYAGLLSNEPGYLMMGGGPVYDAEYIKYKLPKRARLLMASGGDKPVLDNGAPGHSVFAAVLLETLEQNSEILSGPQLFSAISKKVSSRSAASGFDQKPEYKVIKGAGHEAGDFFFIPI